MTTPITMQQLDNSIRAGLRGGPPNFLIPPHETADKNAGYRDNLAHYRRLAQRWVDEGDYRQAAEKSWGSYAQAIKVVAASRGMYVRTHRNILRVAEELYKLAATTDSDAANRLRQGLGMAHSLHQHFYEGDLPDSTVASFVADVMDAIDLMQALFLPTPPAVL